ncbi:MAG: DUF1552 domain-containing protein [Planctomycetia bacterium]|nr:DUF1552 domain-containing protein [Planctomycetia bacterium]
MMHRRTFLRAAAGIGLSLPWLEAMADSPKTGAAGDLPRRLGFVHVPNGMYMTHFQPAQAGKNFTLPYSLAALEPFRSRLNYYTGLDDPNSAHNYAGFLTGTDVAATPGFNFRNTISIDQVVANSPIGQATRFPAINLATSSSMRISWSADSVSQPTLSKPQDLYEMLFVQDPRQIIDARLQHLKDEKRMLDAVLVDAKRVHQQLGAADQRKLDEYLTAVRAVEKDLQRLESWMNKPKPQAKMPQHKIGGPEGLRRLNLSLIALALQTDSTRVFTYYAHDDRLPGHNSHHGGSHCGNEEFADLKTMPANHRDFVEINKLEATIFADFIAQLATMKEGDSTVLDNSCLVYGSAHRMLGHHHRSVPLLSVGSLGGKIRTGYHHVFSPFPVNGEMNRKLSAEYRGRPIGDLHLTLLQQLGIDVKKHGMGSNDIGEICA